MTQDPIPDGRIAAIRGAVVDVGFPEGCLPAVNDALEAARPGGGRLVLEVQAQLDARRRACADGPLRASAGPVALRMPGGALSWPLPGCGLLGMISADVRSFPTVPPAECGGRAKLEFEAEPEGTGSETRICKEDISVPAANCEQNRRHRGPPRRKPR
ncbi:hypothetical protein [Mangrovicoccus ximenensis]|uniref:hypothetical protein n=1 Tax=Mangrovicoccus ximenensis TaxID=1911570 RepID=UPI000D3B0EB0|nr:hypothetical protein [Mangrovicoccus ximenensis]